MLTLTLTLASTAALAADPVLPFSAKLADKQGVPLDGQQSITFRIYNEPAGGIPVWAEVHSAATVIKGVLSVNLGSVSGFGALELTEGYWLGIAVGGDPEMTPRIQIPPQNIVPAGTIVAFGGADRVDDVPVGWMLCDGRPLNNADYPRLYKAIGKRWGGNAGATFNLPDFRGYFLRGKDWGNGVDPDSTKRTSIRGGTGVGDAVGSYQPDAFQTHNHKVYATVGGGSSGSVRDRRTPDHNDFRVVTNPFTRFDESTDYYAAEEQPPARPAEETRPKNAYVNYIIKY